MPSILVYCERVDDLVEEWVDDSDWDQQAWDDWNRMERSIARRLSPSYNTLSYLHYREWHNMCHGAITIAAFDDYSRSK